MHDAHTALPGYSPNQLLHDGCKECEARAAREDHGISNLDGERFRHAWARAARWYAQGLPDCSYAELPMLSALWSVQCQLVRLGVPLGTLPTGR